MVGGKGGEEGGDGVEAAGDAVGHADCKLEGTRMSGEEVVCKGRGGVAHQSHAEKAAVEVPNPNGADATIRLGEGKQPGTICSRVRLDQASSGGEGGEEVGDETVSNFFIVEKRREEFAGTPSPLVGAFPIGDAPSKLGEALPGKPGEIFLERGRERGERGRCVGRMRGVWRRMLGAECSKNVCVRGWCGGCWCSEHSVSTREVAMLSKISSAGNGCS